MQLIGHKLQLEQLRKAAKDDRLAHAYLFTGPNGVGKKLAAMFFVAELLNVPFDKIQSGTHPDVMIVVAEKKDITIEQLRDVQTKLHLQTLEGSYKAVIIDEAERMNASAANSILKTLEEPPKATHIFLITSREHMLLPTIASRCQKIIFSPISEKELAIYVKEKLGTDDKTSLQLANVSGGSIGAALTFPVNILNDVPMIMDKLLKTQNHMDILSTAEDWSEENSEAILSMLGFIYRNKIEEAVLQKRSVFKLERQIQSIMSAQRDLETTYNKQLMFEDLLFTLAS